LKGLSGELPLVFAGVARKKGAESAQEPSFEKATHPTGHRGRAIRCVQEEVTSKTGCIGKIHNL
jgi:hypothetical protein